MSSVDILADVPQHLLDLLPDHMLSPDPYIYLSNNFVVFDLETTTQGDDGSPSAVWPRNSVVCGSWCEGLDGAVQNVYGNELEIGDLVDAIERADFCVAHNGKFDLGWLKRAGIDLYKILLYDTMVGEYVRLGNRKGEGVQLSDRWLDGGAWDKRCAGLRPTAKSGPLQLETLIRRYLGVGKKHFIASCMGTDVCPSEMPRSMILTRCDEDVEYTREVFLLQRDELDALELLPCVYTRCLLSLPLTDIEQAGVCLDPVKVGEEYRDVALKLAAVTAELDEFMEGRNPNSPKQMREFIYGEEAGQLGFKPLMKGRGKNKEPNYTTATEDLLLLSARTKRQKKFMELKQAYARLNADMSKAMLFFHAVCTDPKYDEPTFFARFNQCITVTHRLSSSGEPRTFEHVLDDKGKPITKGIQMQNMPRKYKPMVKARRKGWKVGEADGCFTAGHRMLMSDGTWKDVSLIQTGDTVIAFDEHREGNKTRKLRLATVQATRARDTECYKVTFENGDSVTVSHNHQFLGSDGHSHAQTWLTASNMLTSRRTFYVSKFSDTWDYNGDELLWGTLGGMLDCDGTASHDKFQITQSVDNPVYHRIRAVISGLGFPERVYNFRRSSLSTADVVSFNITGLPNLLKVAALSGSVKARNAMNGSWEGKAMGRNKRIKVVSIEPVGEQTVYSIQNTEGTYIVDGYCNHNCQLEFRVAAFLGQCPVATQAIVNNTDIHTQTATVLTDNGQETSRQGAKEHTFKPLYGGQSGTAAEVAYYSWFREHYTGIGNIQQEWKDQAVIRKQVILPHKFRFYFPEAKLSRDGYVQGSTNICNYPVRNSGPIW